MKEKKLKNNHRLTILNHRNMTTFYFSFLFLLLTSPLFSQTDEKEEILSVMAKQVDGWNNGNIDQYMDGYWQSDSLRFASGGTVTYGWKKTLDRYKKHYDSKQKMGTLIFSKIEVAMISDSAAIVFGQWKLKREQDEPWGLFTLLFKKLESGWKITADHTSSAEK